MKYLPDEQVIPLTEYQCTVDAEDQRLTESDDVTRLVKENSAAYRNNNNNNNFITLKRFTSNKLK